MKGTIQTHPHIGRGWWWEFERQNGHIEDGYALTKRGAIWAMKRQYKKLKFKQKFEVELG